MRKIAAALACAFSFSASAQTLPADTHITPPAASIPAEAKAFSGKWVGKWANTTIEHILVVEDINSPDDIKILYWSKAGNPPSESWARFPAKMDGSSLTTTVAQGRAKVKYTVTPDGSLAGEYLLNDRVTRGVFKKEP